MKNQFPERLRQIRTARGEYQKWLANHLHVSVGTASNYENGVHSPDIVTLGKIAQYYDVSTDYLIGLTDCQYSLDTLNQIISDNYTVGRFLELLNRLSDEDKELLVRLLQLFDK